MKRLYKTAMAVAGALMMAGCSESGEGASAGTDLTAQARAAAAASGYAVREGGDGGVLHIYTWCDYIAPDVIASFERALGVKVVVDTFDSNEAMYAKLKAGGTGYDLITPSSYQVETMAREKFIEALDPAKIPNVRKNFDPAFADQILDPAFTYSVPYAVTYTGFVYIRNKVPQGVEIASWNVLGNPAFRGRVTLLDDIRETIGGALMYLGHSVNSENPKELEAATAQLLKWRANIRKFDAESYKTEVPSGATWIGHGYSTDATQVIAGDEEAGAPARGDIGFALPKEGFSVAFDEFVIASNSKRKDLACAFVNYVYDPEVAKVNMEYIMGPMPVAPGIALLDPGYRRLIVQTPETMKRGQVLRSFEGKPAVMEMYNKAWDRVKATAAGK